MFDLTSSCELIQITLFYINLVKFRNFVNSNSWTELYNAKIRNRSNDGVQETLR